MAKAQSRSEGEPRDSSSRRQATPHVSLRPSTAVVADRGGRQTPSVQGVVQRRRTAVPTRLNRLLTTLIEVVDRALFQMWEAADELAPVVIPDDPAETLQLGRQLVDQLQTPGARSAEEISNDFSYASQVLLQALVDASFKDRHADLLEIADLAVNAYEAYMKRFDDGAGMELSLQLSYLEMKKEVAEYEKKQAATRARAGSSSNQQSASGRIRLQRDYSVVLFWGASPAGEERVLYDEEINEIKALFKEHGNQIRLQEELAVTKDELLKTILKSKPDVIHFSGHGRDSELIFHGAGDDGEGMSLEEIETLFKRAKDSEDCANLRCVVLNACMSEDIAVVIAKHVDTVVGTPSQIGDRAAIAFSRGFYETLALAQNVAYSVNVGSDKMKGEDEDQDSIPRLVEKEEGMAKHIKLVTGMTR